MRVSKGEGADTTCGVNFSRPVKIVNAVRGLQREISKHYGMEDGEICLPRSFRNNDVKDVRLTVSMILF